MKSVSVEEIEQVQEYKDKIANQIKERDNGDFNEQN